LDRFVSHHVNRVDTKGRVSIPAPFRAVLARDGFEGLYVHRSLDAEALDCGGNTLLKQIEAVLDSFSPFSQERDIYSTALLGASEILKLDSEGRVILPDALKDFAGITSEVTYVGQGFKFQIWEPGRFRAHLDEARDQMRVLRKQLSDQYAARGTPLAAPRGARE
jgi:MraZ protein